MKNCLLIIGAGGHGKVVADVAMKMDIWNSIAFLDDDDSLETVMGLKVIDKSSRVNRYIEKYNIFVAIGNNEIRQGLQLQLESLGCEVPTLVHPNAVIGEKVELGQGTVIMAGVVINSYTKVGIGCIINTGATVDHDNVIEDYVHISPGVNTGGTVWIGPRTWLGIGSKVVNNVNIVEGCIIGAGAVVINDLTESGTYVGVPARRIKR
jgi:sugar O-acyltransferase (sialic acid O-acetyltransferase NeuD family)